MSWRWDRGVLFVILWAGLAFSVWYSVSVTQEKQDLETTYQKALTQFEQERLELHDELRGIESFSETQAMDITGLQERLAAVHVGLERTTTELMDLRRERIEWQGERARLQQEAQVLQEQVRLMFEDLSQMQEEKQGLEAKWSSLPELKRAMREVREHNRRTRSLKAHKRRQVLAKKQGEADQAALEAGNRGFVVWKGESTLGEESASISIKVLAPEVP